jgi:hypothetical protein
MEVALDPLVQDADLEWMGRGGGIRSADDPGLDLHAGREA